VTGVDADEEAIAYARERYAAPNVDFEVMDVAALRFAEDSFEVVCSFETIEHVPDRDAFLREVARVLAPDGVFLVSTPQARRTVDQPDNPFHTSSTPASTSSGCSAARSTGSSSTANAGCRRAGISCSSVSTCWACVGG